MSTVIYTGEPIPAQYGRGGHVYVSGHSNDNLILCLNGPSLTVMQHLSAEGARALACQLNDAADAVTGSAQQVAA